MGGSFPVSDWMKEGVETRTERVKRKERERVLDELLRKIDDFPDKRMLSTFRMRWMIEEIRDVT